MVLTPEQEYEINARIMDARNGYCAGDNTVYVRHVDWLLGAVTYWRSYTEQAGHSNKRLLETVDRQSRRIEELEEQIQQAAAQAALSVV